MLLSSKSKINEVIVSLLSRGPLDSLSLLEKTQEELNVSKQGFYKALRELLHGEVVTKHKKSVLLNTVWINRLESFVADVQKNYNAKVSEQILSLSEGDSMVFKFKSIHDLNLLWMHYFYMVAKQLNEPVLFYSYHEFWSLFRSDLQTELYKWTQQNKVKTYYVVGNKTRLDLETTRRHKKYGPEIAYQEKTTLSANTGLTVIGDYIFNTVIDNTTTKAIDEIYKKYSTWEPSVETELKEILERIRRSKVVIERNKKKAETLRKKLMGYFLFYK